jgi:bifunctional non-homologous end joining protein LigD
MRAVELKEYGEKRDFAKTPEPSGAEDSPAEGAAAPTFVVQKHDASRLHYDLRLEACGVLKSWAVPKGPSLDPSQKRLAVRTEDHPLAYGGFEGTIPEGEYGGGTVMVWDAGTVRYEGSEAETAQLVESRKPFAFTLEGSKLAGRWRLVPFNTRGKVKKNWLLIKSRDEHADEATDVLVAKPDSATSGRSLEAIAEGDD